MIHLPTHPQLRAQKGQAVTEAVLIVVMLFGITFLVASYFRQNEVLKQLITAPFANLAGLLQNGVWMPPDRGAALHPTGHGRHITITGEGVR